MAVAIPKEAPAVPQTTGVAMPATVHNNPKLLKLWEKSGEEERKAGLLISEYHTKSAKNDNNERFTFAESWQGLFPKTSKKQYERGKEAVTIGATLAGVSASQVYSELKTAEFYGRHGYEALEKKAQSNGVILYWSHLKLIQEKLFNNKDARHQVERALVQRQMSLSQLKELIYKAAPEVKERQKSEAPKKEQTCVQQLTSAVSSIRGLTKNGLKLEEALDRVNNEDFHGDAEQGDALIAQLAEGIASTEELIDFFTEKIKYMQQLYDTIASMMSGQDKAVKKAAGKVVKQLADEKAEKRKKDSVRAASMAVRGDDTEVNIADSDENDSLPVLTGKKLKDWIEKENVEEDDFEIEVDDSDPGDNIFDEAGTINMNP